MESNDQTSPPFRRSCQGLALMLLVVASTIFALVTVFGPPVSRPKLVPLAGQVMIPDENGGEIAAEGVELTVFSHFAPGLMRRQWARTFWIQTREDGRFNDRRIADRTTVFVQSRDGRFAAIEKFEPAESSENLRIRLRPVVTIKGRLVDRNTGRPVPDANLRLVCAVSSDFGKDNPFSFRENAVVRTFFEQETKTDASGRFVLPGAIPGGAFRIHRQASEGGITYGEFVAGEPLPESNATVDDENRLVRDMGDIPVNPMP